MSENTLKINFIVSTTDGKMNNGLPILYKPTMSNPSIYSQFPDILFIPSIKITKGLFNKDLGEDDIKKIFLSPTQFDNFIMRIREKGLYNPISIKDAKSKGIIYNNIKFILDLFFKNGDKFVINNNQYIINNYKWKNKYDLIPVTGKKAPMVEINLELFLYKGDKISFIDSTRLNCMQTKQSIINDYYELVGINITTSKTAPVSNTPVDTYPPPPKKKTTTTTTTTTSPPITPK